VLERQTEGITESFFYDIKTRPFHCWVKSSVSRFQNQLRDHDLIWRLKPRGLTYISDTRYDKFRNKLYEIRVTTHNKFKLFQSGSLLKCSFFPNRLTVCSLFIAVLHLGNPEMRTM